MWGAVFEAPSALLARVAIRVIVRLRRLRILALRIALLSRMYLLSLGDGGRCVRRPALDDARGNPGDDRVGWHALRHHAARRDHAAAPNRHARQDDRVRSDPAVILDVNRRPFDALRLE